MGKKKYKAECSICNFSLTDGDAEIGDICPWCRRGVLVAPKPPEAEND